MEDRHEIDVHPDDRAECRRMIEAGSGEAEYEHMRATKGRPEWRSSVWNRIGERRTKWFRPSSRGPSLLIGRLSR